MKNNIKIITPFYNASDYIERCVSSIITQKYDNVKVIFIDDCSTDNSWDYLPHDDERCVCIKNDKNVTALPNIHNAIMKYCEADDICVLLDGDDAFLKKDVLYSLKGIFASFM